MQIKFYRNNTHVRSRAVGSGSRAAPVESSACDRGVTTYKVHTLAPRPPRDPEGSALYADSAVRQVHNSVQTQGGEAPSQLLGGNWTVSGSDLGGYWSEL